MSSFNKDNRLGKPFSRGSTPDNHPVSDGVPLIRAQNLARTYGSVVAVHDLSLELRRGQIAALLGPNGAGKSTTLRMLVGFQVPSRGRVILAGHDVFRDGAAAKRHLGYVPENPGYYGEMRVLEYLSHSARLRGLTGARREEAVARAVKQWKLGEMARRAVGNLSRGYRQRVGLAQATLADPDVLILDEPTTGLDPNQAAELRGYLRKKSESAAILISTHLLAEATSLCDYIIIMHKGLVVTQGPRESLSAGASGRPTLRAAVRGGEAIGRLAEARGLQAVRKGSDPPYTWHLDGELEESQRDALLKDIIEASGELVEWSAGQRTLEEIFRSLTVGETER